MGSAGKDDPVAEHTELRQRIAESHEELDGLEPGELPFNLHYDELVRATQQLLALEETLPRRLAEPGRRRSERIVLWSWRGQAALAAVLVVLVLVLGSVTQWWLLLVVPHLVATLGGCWQTVGVADHLQRRVAAIGLHPLGVLMVLTVLGVLSAWWVLLFLGGWIIVGAIAVDAETEVVRGRL